MSGMSRRKTLLFGVLGIVTIALLALVAGPILFVLGGGANFPKPSGEYDVGKTRYSLVDESRTETLSNDDHAPRELVVDLYYPANAPSDAKPEPYIATAITFQVTDGVPAPFLSPVKTSWVSDAPVIDGSFPVLLYSPGLGGPPDFNTTLFEHLVSHGYVVAAIWHPYSMTTLMPDGRILEETPAGVWEEEYSSIEEKDAAKIVVADIWAKDAIFALDQLELINEADPRFAGKLELDQVGMLGHSFGGQNAAAVLLLDDRVTAAINLDGTFIHADVLEQGVSDPLMVIMDTDPLEPPYEYIEETGISLDEWWVSFKERNLPLAVEENADPLIWLVVADSNHYSFTDLPLLRPMFYFIINDSMVGSLGANRSLAITQDYSLAFFDQYLRGVESPLLVGESDAYPEVQFGAGPGDWQ